MDGFLNVIKPPGFTSHDVVALARKLSGERRIGHLGTLDPLARGVLPIALGTYRRLSQYFLDDDKRYLAEFVFGLSSDTGDLDGLVIGEKSALHLQPAQVAKTLESFTGAISQEPPAFSALKVDGQKMYRLAREGQPIRHDPRGVTVHEFKLLSWTGGTHPRGIFGMRVGRGTYVRSLAADLGGVLSVGGLVSYLLRMRSGMFTLKDAHTINDLQEAAAKKCFPSLFSDPLKMLPNMAKLQLRNSSLEKVIHGVQLSHEDFEEPDPVRSHGAVMGPFLVYEVNESGTNRVIAVVRKEGGRLTYDKVLTRESDTSANSRFRKRR